MLSQIATDAVQNPKVAGVVAAATTGSGISTALEWIPADIGTVATLFGIVLSIVLIVTHLFKAFSDHKEHKIRITILESKANNAGQGST